MGPLVLLLAACAQGTPPSPDLAARVGSREVRYGDFERHVRDTVGEEAAVLEGAVLSRLLDRYLEEEALLELGRHRGVQGGRREVLEALLAAEVARGPSPEEIREYYDTHREQLRHPARVRLRQILVEDRSSAERAAEEIAAGASFEEMARRVSQDPTAELGGDQGTLPLESLPPVFAEILAELEEGEVSSVVEADYGFHLFQLIERRPEAPMSLSEAEERIRDRLEREGADAAYRRLVEQARDRYDVQLYERNLPFAYRPPPAP